MASRLWALPVLSSVLLGSVALAGPWTPDPGHGYAKIWFRWLPGFGYHAGDGRTISYSAYHEVFLTGYGEVGLLPGLALTAHVPLVNLFALEDPRVASTTAHVSAGDPAIGLRWRFLRAGRFVLAAEASVRAPIANSSPVQTVFATEAGGGAIGALQVGSGVWDVATSLGFGYGWDRAYVAGSIGHVYRTGDFDGVLTWTAEGGGRLSERWNARARITRWHSLLNGSAPRAESPSGIGNGTSYLGFAVEGEYNIAGAWVVGGTLEGGLGFVRRQTGGPVLSFYFATTF